MQNSSSEQCKQKYFEDTNNEEDSREEHNYAECKYFIKWKIMMMKLVSLSRDRTAAMFGSKVSWPIIIKIREKIVDFTHSKQWLKLTPLREKAFNNTGHTINYRQSSKTEVFKIKLTVLVELMF